jgi:menaquinone-9 beta-reductase
MEQKHYALSRTLMDDWLIREAYQSGVDVRQSIRVQRIEGTYSVTTDQGEFNSKILVGADGRNSWVSRTLKIPTGKATCRRVAWQARAAADDVAEGVHMKFFDHGYIGTVRHQGEGSNICIVINQPARLSPQEVAARYLGLHSSLAWKSVTPLSRQPSPVAQGRALLIGDAARIIEPFTGEGTYMALRSGQLAAQCISQALQQNKRETLASHYTHAHQALYHHLPFHNRLTRWLALHPKIAQNVVALLQTQPKLLELLLYSNLYSGKNSIPQKFSR